MVAAALERLGSPQKEIMHMAFFKDLTHATIAEQLGSRSAPSNHTSHAA